MNELSIFNKFPTIFPANLFEEEVNNFLSGFEKTFAKNQFTLPCDVYDKYQGDKKLATVIEIAAAGFKKEDCTVSVKNDILTLKLGKTAGSPEEGVYKDGENITRKYLSKRIANRTATFSWTLAQNIDTEKISVKYEDGILKIELPIIQPDEPKEKVIEIE